METMVVEAVIADLSEYTGIEKQALINKLHDNRMVHDNNRNIVGEINSLYLEGQILKATIKIYTAAVLSRTIAEVTKNISNEIGNTKYPLQ